MQPEDPGDNRTLRKVEGKRFEVGGTMQKAKDRRQ
jgi:hypothetical protein